MGTMARRQWGPPGLKGSAANAAEVTRAPFAASTVGIQLTPLAIDMTAATARRYAIEVQRSEDDRFTGAEPIIHPGSIAFFQVQVILPQCDIGPGIHRWAQVQHLARPLAGKGYVGTGTVTSMYERGGRKYGQVDGSLLRDGVEIIRAREDFIYAMES